MKTRILTLIMSLFITTMAFAYDAKISGIYYNFDETNKTAEVTYHSSDYNSYSGDIVIPASVSYDGIAYNVTSIGDYAFRSCSSLTSISIPNSVTSIGYEAFRGCTSLTSITIPNSITSIGDYAFSDCSYLASITIPNSVTSIGDYAFSDCSRLTSITIPNSVTSIGDYAFLYCSRLTSITIPNSVTYIGKGAFRSCLSLMSITIPNSVTFIGDYAFENCGPMTINIQADNLENYCKTNINQTLYNKITNNARSVRHLFIDGVEITELNIPEHVTSISSYAFYNCGAITSITIPNSVTSIGDYAFSYCLSLTSITIPNSVTSIGEMAFYWCSSLTSITIPNSITSIGEDAFENCSSLENVYISDIIAWCNIDFDGYYSNPLYYAKNLYLNGEEVTNLVITEGVTSIGDYAFNRCSSLTSITIPNSVTSIGVGTFYNCDALTSITIPNSVTSIGDEAFYDCDALTSITIPNSVTEVGAAVFYGCNSLKSVILSENMTSLPSFYDYYDTYGFFENCIALTSITIPNSVTSIGDEAFYDCDALTSITIPNSITSIGENAFYNCSSLSSVHISDIAAWCNIDFDGYYSNPLYYAENLYLNNKRITQLEIPEGVTKFKYYAFYNCDFLTHITIPSTLTHIDDCAIADCDSLFLIYMKPKERPYFNGSSNCVSHLLSKNPNLKQIIVPCGSGDSYYSYNYNEVKEINTNISNLLIIKDKNSFATYKGIYNYTFNEQQFTKNGTLNLGGVNWTLSSDGGYVAFRNSDKTVLYFQPNANWLVDNARFAAYFYEGEQYVWQDCVDSSKDGIYEVVVPNESNKNVIFCRMNPATKINSWDYRWNQTSDLTVPNNNNNDIFIMPDGVWNDADNSCWINMADKGQQIGFPNQPATYITLKTEDITDKITKIIVNTSGASSINATFNVLVNGTRYTPSIVNLTNAATEYEFTGAESGEIILKWTNNSSKAIYIKSIYIETEKEIYLCDYNGESRLGYIDILNTNCDEGTIEIKAIPYEGHTFIQWSDGNTENPRTISAHELLVAEFSMSEKYTVSLSCDTNEGTVTGSGEYDENANVTIEAIANEGYHFVKWSDGNTENPRTIVVTEDLNLTAEFAINQYEVTVTADRNGYVTGRGTYDYGTEVTIEAIADEGYRFVEWSDGNSENPRTIVVTEDVELMAEFAINQYEVNVMADENGYVTGSGTYNYGTEVMIEAIANEGYHFMQWSDGNIENPRTIVVTEDVELRAEFEEDGKTLVDNVDELSVMIYVQNGVIYVEGAETDYHVLDAAGRLIYSGRDAQLSLPRGVYVIAIGGEVEKIVL